MGKQTVFIKRYPSKGELPIIQGKEYLTDIGKMHDYVIHPNRGNIEYWIEEIELPSVEEILKDVKDRNQFLKSEFIKGVSFILNKLKGE